MQVPGFVSLVGVFVGVTHTRTQVSGIHSLIRVRTFFSDLPNRRDTLCNGDGVLPRMEPQRGTTLSICL